VKRHLDHSWYVAIYACLLMWAGCVAVPNGDAPRQRNALASDNRPVSHQNPVVRVRIIALRQRGTILEQWAGSGSGFVVNSQGYVVTNIMLCRLRTTGALAQPVDLR